MNYKYPTIFMCLLFTITALTQTNEQSFPTDVKWPEWVVAKDNGACVQALNNQDAEKWLRWVIPLPKRVRWAGKIVLPTSDFGLQLRARATDIEQNAADELIDLIKKKTGVNELKTKFSVLIGVCDTAGKIDGVLIPGAENLKNLKNNDQAYIISPLSVRGIAISGLTERGVYYGVKTFRQLIEPMLRDGNITVPVVTILDWPDIAERGEWGAWGTSAQRIVRYMADRKLNLMEFHNRQSLSFDKDGRGQVKVDTATRDLARLHAVKYVHITGHFDRFGKRTGIYKVYPKAEGQGTNIHLPSRDDLVIPCGSSEDFIRAMADWIESCASQNVAEMNFYLTETHTMRCDCEKCKGKSQHVLEAEACVKAWQLAREKYPNCRIRILLTQGSYDVNSQILAIASQPEIGITYYSGIHTYTAARAPIIYSLLEDFAKSGRWLGCYPQLTASWQLVSPWCGPQFVKYRMTEFVDKELACVCSYPQHTHYEWLFDFNVTASAEWSWNAHGRSEHEFSAAWATQRGFEDPEKVADWAVMLGPVGWDVYGGPAQLIATTLGMLKKRKAPILGQKNTVFCNFPTVQHMDDDINICRNALILAQQLNAPELIGETGVIQGFVRMIKTVYIIGGMVAEKEQFTEAQTQSMQTAFDELQSAGQQVAESYHVWLNAVYPDLAKKQPNFLSKLDVRQLVRKTITDIHETILQFGIRIKPMNAD